MEAVGRLAGGIAHDFNNLLTGISGNISLALMDIEPDNPVHSLLKEARKATTSASELTGQLLAFSRKQVVDPIILNVNRRLHEMLKMLERIVGETVQITTLFSEDTLRIRFDPGQLQQILMNLVLNARDAMPNGGELTVRTSLGPIPPDITVPPESPEDEDYVVLEITDTGEGMTAQTLTRLFEPFFTTKPQGQGTGLGLATIYGAMKQIGGGIDVQSQLGKGATFRIYLPAVATEEPTEPTIDLDPGESTGGNETILLVEDDTTVRTLASEILRRLGYRLFVASSGEEGLEIANDLDLPIDLLLTDVVKPGMNGWELAS